MNYAHFSEKMGGGGATAPPPCFLRQCKGLSQLYSSIHTNVTNLGLSHSYACIMSHACIAHVLVQLIAWLSVQFV